MKILVYKIRWENALIPSFVKRYFKISKLPSNLLRFGRNTICENWHFSEIYQKSVRPITKPIFWEFVLLIPTFVKSNFKTCKLSMNFRSNANFSYFWIKLSLWCLYIIPFFSFLLSNKFNQIGEKLLRKQWQRWLLSASWNLYKVQFNLFDQTTKRIAGRKCCTYFYIYKKIYKKIWKN